PPNPTDAAKLIILTVKITDFATATLQQIAQQIRQRHPEIHCLLVVTCLHEAYPPTQTNHPTPEQSPTPDPLIEHQAAPPPSYPPQLPEVTRAFQQIQQDFQGLFDRAVMVDFTLETDGFTPQFYGLETLVEAIATLLPEAEARTLSQLLSQRAIGDDISNLYRDAARRYILPFSIMAGTLAAVPLPLATMPVLTALQVSLVGLLGQLYGQPLSVSQAGGVVSAIAGGFLAQTIGRELVKLIPGLGSVIAASWASAYTWALGEAACVYFGDLMGGKTPDPQRIQAVMQETFKLAKTQLQPIKA
ncbi:MAG: YcjF family protein, partial [Synechococcales bacterium]|nr:YcjF family protein [Synechococcales bacterium]